MIQSMGTHCYVELQTSWGAGDQGLRGSSEIYFGTRRVSQAAGKNPGRGSRNPACCLHGAVVCDTIDGKTDRVQKGNPVPSGRRCPPGPGP